MKFLKNYARGGRATRRFLFLLLYFLFAVFPAISQDVPLKEGDVLTKELLIYLQSMTVDFRTELNNLSQQLEDSETARKSSIKHQAELQEAFEKAKVSSLKSLQESELSQKEAEKLQVQLTTLQTHLNQAQGYSQTIEEISKIFGLTTKDAETLLPSLKQYVADMKDCLATTQRELATEIRKKKAWRNTAIGFILITIAETLFGYFYFIAR